MKCARAETFVQAYVDRELTGVDWQDVDRHMSDCSSCAETARLQARFKAAVRGHLPRPMTPSSLRTRIETAIAAEPPATRSWSVARLPRFVPALAAAAALVLIVSTARRRASPLVEQAVRTYNAAMPLDVVGSNCAQIARWFQGKLDFNVTPPPLGKKATCQGGRLVNVQDRFGALLTYQAPGGHRLALLVYDGDDEPVAGGQRRVMAGRDVSFGSSRGASLAAFRDRDGLSYVVTSDLDEEALKDVVLAAFPDNR